MYEFNTERTRAQPKVNRHWGRYSFVLLLFIGLASLIPMLAVGYSKLFGWGSLTTFMTVMTLAVVFKGFRDSSLRQENLLKSALTEFQAVTVDIDGVKFAHGRQISKYSWKEIEHVAEVHSEVLFLCKGSERFVLHKNDIAQAGSLSEFLAFARSQVEKYGLQPPDYFRFSIERDAEGIHKYPSVIVDAEGFKILEDEKRLQIPWRKIRDLTLQRSVLMFEFIQDAQTLPDGFAFAKGEFTSDEGMEAFIAFSMQRISESRLH